TVVRHAGHAPGVVAVHAVAHGAGDELEIAGRVGLRQFGDENARLGTDVAAERLAEAAIAAARSSLIRLRDDRARRRERVIAELARGRFEVLAGLIHLQRGQRIVAPARRLEHVAAVDLLSLQVAGLAGNTQLVFGAIVIRLEFRVADRPVDD